MQKASMDLIADEADIDTTGVHDTVQGPVGLLLGTRPLCPPFL